MVRIHSYKGVGHIPKNLGAKKDASKPSKPRERILLDRLPVLLRGYGNTFTTFANFANCSANSPTAIILVCDLDDKCLKAFRQELFNILNACNPQPETRFCIAIEESEAWFLGDIPAVKSAYPKAKDAVLNVYVNNSVCGTWEHLADAVYNGGLKSLSKKGWQAVGTEKSRWAEKISPQMDVANNASPSFVHFREKLLELVGAMA